VFQDGSGGGPTDSLLTRGAGSLRTRARAAVTVLCGAVQPRSNLPRRPGTARRGKRPRSRGESTAAAYNTTPRRAALPFRRASDRLETGRSTRPRRKCTLSLGRPAGPVLADPNFASAACGRAEFPGSTLRIHPFGSMRFHVLLNSLFKVLFNFPSRYLSAIGLVPVFSLRWSLPPALGCIPKQPDSKEARSRRFQRRHGPDTRSGQGHDQEDLSAGPGSNRPPIHHISRRPRGREIRCWALPASLAVTGGILVSFFSSAY
jgi:hypothetical protein